QNGKSPGDEVLARLAGKGRVSIDRAQRAGRPDVVEEEMACLSEISATRRDTRDEGRNAGFPCVGENDREVERFGAESLSGTDALPELEPPMLEGELVDGRDAVHSLAERRGPGRSHEMNDRVRTSLLQFRDEALRHHRVADPGRRDDQDFFQ